MISPTAHALPLLVVSMLFSTGLGCTRVTEPAKCTDDRALEAGTTSVVGSVNLVEIMKEPSKWANQTIDVIIVEPLLGPNTPEKLQQATHGQVQVRMPDHRASDLSLVPRTWTAGSATRYMTKFDRVVTGPIHVVGELIEDLELSRKDHHSWVLRVHTLEPAAVEAPVSVASIDELARYDRRAVVYEGTYKAGFERSSLDGKAWLGVYEAATLATIPRGAARRVRATGFVFAQPGQRYGHLGSAAYELVATKLEDLGPASDAEP